jgi:gliding motility-associated-like protein
VFDFVVDVFPADTPYAVLLYKNDNLYEFGSFSSINAQTPNLFVFDSLLYAGDYEIRVITSVNDTCYESFSFVDPPSLQFDISTTNPISCDTSGTISVTNITGGAQPIDVGVIDNQGFSPIYYDNLTQGFFDIENLSPGFYSFAIQDNYGCITNVGNDIPIEISQGVLPMDLSYSMENQLVVCVEGGLSPYQFVLNGDTTLSNDSCVDYGLCDGSYTVFVLDSYSAKECKDSISFELSEIEASIDQLEKEVKVESGGFAPYSYSWSFNGDLVDGENDSIFNGQFCEGNYQCEVMDKIGCSKTVSLTIDPINLNSTKDIDCMDPDFNVLEVSPEGGTGPYLVNWNDGMENLMSVTNLSPQTYKVVVTDYHNCTAQDEIEIPVVTDSCLFNAFSPNGDFVNDEWTINSSFLFENSEVSIYNRWGKKIFYSLGYKNGWDGTNKSKNDCAEGVYFYVIDLKNGHDKVKGSVSLFR